MPIDFSIVIPTYDRPIQLERCLRAIAGMDYAAERFEVIIIDDGGNIALDELANRWKDRLHVTLVRQANGGPAAARNTGIERSAGACIAFTDDDCEPAPDWLTCMAAALEREKDGAIVGGRTLNALEDNVFATVSQMIVDIVYDYYNHGGTGPRFFATNNMVLPAADLLELGGFDPSFRTSEDRDLCDRWLASGRSLVYEPKAVVSHAHHLDFFDFVRQHFNYGRGARKFSLAHSNRQPSSSSLDAGFYAQLFGRIRSALKGRERKFRIAVLLLVWQLANTAGFVYEMLFPARGAPGGKA